MKLRNLRCRSRASKGKLPFGWVDTSNFGWFASIHKKLSESAVSAPDVNPTQTRLGV